MAPDNSDASATLALLEERLRRIDFVLNGTDPSRHEPSPARSKSSTSTSSSAALRLKHLERDLHALSSQSPAVADLLALQKSHPELFNTHPASHVPTTLSQSALASLILAHATLYRNTASQLSQLNDLSVPDASSATKLIEQRARIEKARATQGAQAKEAAELRTRSARIVEEWYEGGVLDMGEQWAEWEERLREVEILVRRKEAVKKREEGTV